MKTGPGRTGVLVAWRQRSLEVQTSSVVARPDEGPAPPPAWAARLEARGSGTHASRRAALVDAARRLLRQRGDPHRSSGLSLGRDAAARAARPSLVFFQFTLAGWGQFELYGRAPRRAPAGDRLLRRRPLSPSLLPAGGVAWVDVRLDRHLPPLHPASHRQAGRGHRAADSTPPSSQLDRAAPCASCGAPSRKTSATDTRWSWRCSSSLLAYETAADEIRDPEGDRERLLEWFARASSRAPAAARRRRRGRRARDEPQSLQPHFRDRTGTTPAHFAAEVRIQEAARLLVTTRLPIRRIASECGFADGQHSARSSGGFFIRVPWPIGARSPDADQRGALRSTRAAEHRCERSNRRCAQGNMPSLHRRRDGV